MRELSIQEISAVSGAGLFTDVLDGGLIGLTVAALLIIRAPEELAIFAPSLILYGTLIGASLPLLKLSAQYLDLAYASYYATSAIPVGTSNKK